jgi:hypothetical protein
MYALNRGQSSNPSILQNFFNVSSSTSQRVRLVAVQYFFEFAALVSRNIYVLFKIWNNYFVQKRKIIAMALLMSVIRLKKMSPLKKLKIAECRRLTQYMTHFH